MEVQVNACCPMEGIKLEIFISQYTAVQGKDQTFIPRPQILIRNEKKQKKANTQNNEFFQISLLNKAKSRKALSPQILILK